MKRVSKSLKFFDAKAKCEEEAGRASWKAMLGGGTHDEGQADARPQTEDLAGVLAEPEAPERVACDEEEGMHAVRKGDTAGLCDKSIVAVYEGERVEPQHKQAKLAQIRSLFPRGHVWARLASRPHSVTMRRWCRAHGTYFG